MERKKLNNPWLRLEGYNCIGCAPGNPFGVHLEPYEEGDEIVAEWQPSVNYQGWLNTLHGGIHALLLDEICGWVVMRKLQTAGVTSKMEIRYKRPVATTGGKLTVRAHIRDNQRNLYTIDAELIDAEGRVCTEATCVYFTFSHEKAERDMHFIPVTAEGEEAE